MIQTFHSSDVLHVAFFRNVVISHTQGRLNLTEMSRIGDAYRAALRHFPAGISAFVVLCPGTPVADRDALQESSRFMTEVGASLLTCSIVIEEAGVMAQMLTTVIRGINVITRRRNMVVFATQDDALRATAPYVRVEHPGEPITRLLKEAVSTARTQWKP